MTTDNPFLSIEYRLDSISAELSKLRKDLSKPEQKAVDTWMTIIDICEYLPHKPNPGSIYKLVYDRKIPHKKVGKHLYFLKSEIDQWLQEGKRMTENEISEHSEIKLANQLKNSVNK